MAGIDIELRQARGGWGLARGRTVSFPVNRIGSNTEWYENENDTQRAREYAISALRLFDEDYVAYSRIEEATVKMIAELCPAFIRAQPVFATNADIFWSVVHHMKPDAAEEAALRSCCTVNV
jgi:hypothetical protein